MVKWLDDTAVVDNGTIRTLTPKEEAFGAINKLIGDLETEIRTLRDENRMLRVETAKMSQDAQTATKRAAALHDFILSIQQQAKGYTENQ